MKSTIIFLLSVIGFIAAYDFEDHAYNELLSEELFVSNPRIRRDTKNSNIDQNSCCSDGAIKNFHAADKDISAQCSKELNLQPGAIRGPLSDDQKNKLKCVVECIGKRKGYLDDNGVLLKDKFLNIIKERLGTVDWLAPKLDDLFERCLTNAPAKQENVCNDIGLTVGHCIWKEIQLECPLDKQENAAKCEALQKYLRENNSFPPLPRGPH